MEQVILRCYGCYANGGKRVCLDDSVIMPGVRQGKTGEKKWVDGMIVAIRNWLYQAYRNCVNDREKKNDE